jgi:hypothetical protein
VSAFPRDPSGRRADPDAALRAVSFELNALATVADLRDQAEWVLAGAWWRLIGDGPDDAAAIASAHRDLWAVVDLLTAASDQLDMARRCARWSMDRPNDGWSGQTAAGPDQPTDREDPR